MATQGTEPGGWQEAFLKSIGAPVTQTNLTFLTEWFNEEHGSSGTTGEPLGGLYNPFDTTLKAPGSTTLAGNSAGVQNYQTPAEGIAATASTIEESAYANLLAALRNPNSTVSSLQSAEAASPWGTWGSYPSTAPSNVPSVSTEGTLYSTIYKGDANQGASGSSLTPAEQKADNAYANASNNNANAIVNGVKGTLSSLDPLSWLENAAGEIFFLIFGLALVIVGLVVTFRQEGNVEKAGVVAAAA